jgi:hypothetical protein
MRLQTIVYAPRLLLDTIIQKHALLKTLFFNKWVALVAIDPQTNKAYRFIQEGEWIEIIEQKSLSEIDRVKFYNNKIGAIATMHGKEKVISPAFFDSLGLTTLQAKIDTDQLGTFTGEIERKGDALTCAREKCELIIKEGIKIAISSEGSFGPHPLIPFIACDHEILYFIDSEKGFHLHQTLLSSNTNYCSEVISTEQRLETFCEQVLFPSHALIVRPNKAQNRSIIFKGIQDFKELKEVFFKCCSLSSDGKALLETDMRAHMNPTRMDVIKELADSFAKRLATPCPSCSNPGWGIVETQPGLECELCGSETDLVKFEIFGCPKCPHKELKSRQDGLTQADSTYCNFCNP